MHLADAFKATYSTFRLYICIVSMCVPWESNPQPLRCLHNALTTELQEQLSWSTFIFKSAKMSRTRL